MSNVTPLKRAESPADFTFEQRYGRHIWRLQTLENGKISLWPWYEKDGEIYPCAARYGGGLQLPTEAAHAMAAAILNITA